MVRIAYAPVDSKSSVIGSAYSVAVARWAKVMYSSDDSVWRADDVVSRNADHVDSDLPAALWAVRDGPAWLRMA